MICCGFAGFTEMFGSEFCACSFRKRSGTISTIFTCAPALAKPASTAEKIMYLVSIRDRKRGPGLGKFIFAVGAHRRRSGIHLGAEVAQADERFGLTGVLEGHARLGA